MYFIFETTDGWNLKPRKMELMLKLPNMMVSWIYFYGKLKNLKYWLLENLHDSLTMRATFSNFSKRYIPWITHEGHDSKGNDN